MYSGLLVTSGAIPVHNFRPVGKFVAGQIYSLRLFLFFSRSVVGDSTFFSSFLKDI